MRVEAGMAISADDYMLEVALMPVAAVVGMILRGEMIDGSLQLGVLLALQQGLIPIG